MILALLNKVQEASQQIDLLAPLEVKYEQFLYSPDYAIWVPGTEPEGQAPALRIGNPENKYARNLTQIEARLVMQWDQPHEKDLSDVIDIHEAASQFFVKLIRKLGTEYRLDFLGDVRAQAYFNMGPSLMAGIQAETTAIMKLPRDC